MQIPALELCEKQKLFGQMMPSEMTDKETQIDKYYVSESDHIDIRQLEYCK